MPARCTTSLETLLALRDDALPASEAAALRRHVDQGCPDCAERLAWLARTIPALAPPPTPSPAARAYVQSLARLLPRPEPRPNLVRYIAEALAPSLRPAAIPAGARGGRTLQRLYETDAHLLTLWDEPDDTAGRYLIGQVYAREGGPLLPRDVVLLGAGATRSADCEDSEFHLSAVPPGAYVLRCELDAAEIYIPRLVVGP